MSLACVEKEARGLGCQISSAAATSLARMLPRKCLCVCALAQSS